MDENIILTVVYGIVVLLISILGYMFYDSWRLRRLRKNYNEDNDLSKKGEQRRNVVGRTTGYRRTSDSARAVLENDVTARAKKNSNRTRGIFKTLRR